MVIDLPEAVFGHVDLLYLNHTHIPTVRDAQNTWIDNVDWARSAGGALISRWLLPNGVSFGAEARLEGGEVRMELWLRNGTARPLSGLRTQICVMLGRAPGFRGPAFESAVASVRDASGRSIHVEWERAGRTWATPQSPACIPTRCCPIVRLAKPSVFAAGCGSNRLSGAELRLDRRLYLETRNVCLENRPIRLEAGNVLLQEPHVCLQLAQPLVAERSRPFRLSAISTSRPSFQFSV